MLCMLGYEQGELQVDCTTWHRLIHPHDLDFLLTSIDAHVTSRGEIPIYAKVRFRSKAGQTVWLLCLGQVVSWSADHAPERLAGCCIDITQQQAAEDQNEFQRNELQQILDAIPEYIFYKDNRNNILNCNAAAAASIGLTRDQIIGRKASEFFQDADKYFDDDLGVLTEQQMRLGKTERFTDLLGQERTLRVDKIPLRNPIGQYDRLVTIVADVS